MTNLNSQWKAGIFGGAALVTLTMVGTGLAQAADLGGSIKDDPVYQEQPARFSWRGLYLGATAGAAFDHRHIDLSPASPAAIPYFTGSAVPGELSQRHTGFIGGVTAGYNWQAGSLVYGIEVDYSGLSGHGTSSTVNTTAAGFVPFSSSGSSKVDQLATLRARLGWAVAPQTLLYVTGGLAAGHTGVSTTISQTGSACNGTSFCATGASSDWKTGWTLGAGIEQALNRSWTIKAEYLHYDLGSASFNSNDPGVPAVVFQSKTRFEGDIVRAGINYKF
jgi:outer membrane immunogenic protein